MIVLVFPNEYQKHGYLISITLDNYNMAPRCALDFNAKRPTQRLAHGGINLERSLVGPKCWNVWVKVKRHQYIFENMFENWVWVGVRIWTSFQIKCVFFHFREIADNELTWNHDEQWKSNSSDHSWGCHFAGAIHPKWLRIAAETMPLLACFEHLERLKKTTVLIETCN